MSSSVSGLACWRNREWGFGFGSRWFDCETLVFNKASQDGSHAKTRIIGPPDLRSSALRNVLLTQPCSSLFLTQSPAVLLLYKPEYLYNITSSLSLPDPLRCIPRMSPDATARSSHEQRRPLRSESFDSIDDLETVGNGHCSHHKRSSRSGDDWYRSRRSWRNTSGWLRPRNISIAFGVLAALVLIAVFWHKRPGRHHAPKDPDGYKPLPPPMGGEPAKPTDEKPASPYIQATNTPSVSPWEKPKGFKIIGLIFFGRPPVVEILDCYLKRNLVSNGGFLDEVLWVANTKNEEDLKYMDGLVAGEPLYRKLILSELGYESVWEHAVDDKNMFIKIDDDMVCLPDIRSDRNVRLLIMFRRSILATMLSLTSSTPKSSIQKHSMSSQTLLIVQRLAGFTITWGLYMLTCQRRSLL